MRRNLKNIGPLIESTVLVFLFVTTTVAAETVVLNPTKDNTLIESKTGNRSNGEGDLFSGRTGSAGEDRALRAVMAFDVAGNIPAGSIIHCVTLRLQLITASPVGDINQTHTLHRVLADWGEGNSSAFGGMGDLSEDCDATWIHTFNPSKTKLCGGLWTSAGGDFDPTPSDSQVVGQSTAVKYEWNSAQMASDVQDWLDNPSTNFGWLLKGNEDLTFTARKFGSRENKVVEDRPELVIRYSPPGSCLEDCYEPTNNIVDVDDLGEVFIKWNTDDPACDIDSPCGNGVVDVDDLGAIFINWGACE